jgi:hypothetical protein
MDEESCGKLIRRMFTTGGGHRSILRIGPSGEIGSAIKMAISIQIVYKVDNGEIMVTVPREHHLSNNSGETTLIKRTTLDFAKDQLELNPQWLVLDIGCRKGAGPKRMCILTSPTIQNCIPAKILSVVTPAISWNMCQTRIFF